MNVELPVHNSIRILLINKEEKVLLMYADDVTTTSKDGSYYGSFWYPIGGRVEFGESVIGAATRELKEETGLSTEDVVFGHIVWFGEFEMVLSGRITRMKQKFMVAHTKKEVEITLEHLTPEEASIIKKISWFSLDEIKHSKDVIYPVVLKDHLPDILDKKYPAQPMWIDLAKKPER